MNLSRTPYLGSAPSGWYFGAKFGHPEGLWLTDPWGKKLEGAPLSAKVREELLKYSASDSNAQAPKYAGDAISRRLDSITLEDHMLERHGISRETFRRFPLARGRRRDTGLAPMPFPALRRMRPTCFIRSTSAMKPGSRCFPMAIGGIARLIVKTLIPESIAGEHSLEDVCRNAVNFAALDRAGAPARVRLDSTAVWVKHDDAKHDGDPAKSEFVTVAYTRGRKIFRVKARSVVMAGGSWTTRHIVRDLPAGHVEAYSQFYRAPCMMANVAVRNWRFLYKMGISGGQWFEGLGNYTQVRKMALCGPDAPTISPDSPTVLTLKVLYPHPGQPTEQQGHLGRAELISTPFRDYERQIRQQFTEMFARTGFDAGRDIAGIILNRWGHAYLSPSFRLFLRQEWQAGSGRCSARGSARKDRIREHRLVRGCGPPVVDY